MFFVSIKKEKTKEKEEKKKRNIKSAAIFPSQCWDYKFTLPLMAFFPPGWGDWNSGPQACINILLTEESLPPYHPHIFIKRLGLYVMNLWEQKHTEH